MILDHLLVLNIHIWLYDNIYWPFQEGLMMTRHEKEKKTTIMMNAFDRLLNVTYIWRYNLILLDIFSTYFPLKSLILHEMNHFLPMKGHQWSRKEQSFVCVLYDVRKFLPIYHNAKLHHRLCNSVKTMINWHLLKEFEPKSCVTLKCHVW